MQHQVSLRDILNTIFYYRHLMVWVILFFFCVSVVLAIVMPPVYRAEARLLTLYAGYYDMQINRAAGRAAPSFNPTQVVNVEAQILSSPELHRAIVRKEIGMDADTSTLDEALRAFERHFHLEKVEAANVIEVSYTAADPDRAADVLNQLIAQYFRQRSDVFTQGRVAFLISQRDKVREQLDAANVQISAFQRAHGVVDVDAQISSAVSLDGLLRQRALENERSLAQDSSSLDSLMLHVDEVPLDIELFRDNTEATHALSTMQLSLLQLKSRRADLASRYMTQSPFVRQMDMQIADIDNAINAQKDNLISAVRTGHNTYYDTLRDRIVRLRSDVAGETARQTSLEAQTRDSAAAIQRLISVSNQLRRMEIDRDLLTESFKVFSRQVEEVRIEQNQMNTSSSTNVRIVQAPFPPTHRSNPPLLFIAAGLVAGILVAGLSVIVLSSLRETFLSPEEVERALDLPVLIAPLSTEPPPSTLERLSKAPLIGAAFRALPKPQNATPAAPPPYRKNDFGRLIMAVNTSSEARSKLVLLLSFRDNPALPGIIEGLVDDLERRSPRSVLLLDLTGGTQYGFFDTNGGLHWPGAASLAPSAVTAQPSANAEMMESVFDFSKVIGRRIVVGRPRPDAVMPIGLPATELFQAVRESHDFVVIHGPSAIRSFIGIETSILADATVLTVQAEETREPVAQTLKSQVLDAGGMIAGVVMTNRRSYIPNAIYKLL